MILGERTGEGIRFRSALLADLFRLNRSRSSLLSGAQKNEKCTVGHRVCCAPRHAHERKRKRKEERKKEWKTERGLQSSSRGRNPRAFTRNNAATRRGRRRRGGRFYRPPLSVSTATSVALARLSLSPPLPRATPECYEAPLPLGKTVNSGDFDSHP